MIDEEGQSDEEEVDKTEDKTNLIIYRPTPNVRVSVGDVFGLIHVTFIVQHNFGVLRRFLFTHV